VDSETARDRKTTVAQRHFFWTAPVKPELLLCLTGTLKGPIYLLLLTYALGDPVTSRQSTYMCVHMVLNVFAPAQSADLLLFL